MAKRYQGKRKAVRPPRLGRALGLSLAALLLPALALSAVGAALLNWQRDALTRLLVHPDSLLVVAGVLVVGTALWVGLICRTYARKRPRPLAPGSNALGMAAVAVLCVLVTGPMVLGTRYLMVQRDLITTVFHGEQTATAPEVPQQVTRRDPWQGRKRVNLLLLGGDGDVGRPGVRTDSVILASIHVATGRTTLFSLPRNLRDVPFPEGTPLAELYPYGFDGGGSDGNWMLNAVYRNVPALHPGVLGRSQNEGADAVKLAVSGVLGLRVDYYVLVNLAGFEQIVDAIGGITVNINRPVAVGGNSDRGIEPDYYLETGPAQRLDGFHALWFTRGRYGSSDYQRMQRQRCAVNALLQEARPVNLLRRYTGLAAAGKDILRTDIPQQLLPAFVELAERMKGQKLFSVGFELSDAFNPNEPDFDYVHRTVDAALRPARPVRPAVPVSPSESPSPAPAEESVEDVEAVGHATEAESDCSYQPKDGSEDGQDGVEASAHEPSSGLGASRANP